ncbi:MAG TPA: hypothetical protein VF163_20795 [Micromonosporaceae bacterium]
MKPSTVTASVDPRLRKHARAVIDYVTGGSVDLAEVNGVHLLYFVWYQLPAKWSAPAAELAEVAAAAAELMRAVGKPRIAELIDAPKTSQIHRAWLVDRSRAIRLMRTALAASGLVPPDTDLLQWSSIMGVAESKAHLVLGGALEQAIDTGVFVPGQTGWKRIQANLAEAWLTTRSVSFGGAQPLDAIHAERRQAWLDQPPVARRAALTPILPALDRPGRAEDTPGPLRSLLELVGDGVALTPAGYLPTTLVATASQWYPEWLKYGRVRSESDSGALLQLRQFAEEAKLLTRRSRRLTVSASGRAAMRDPGRLDRLAAEAWLRSRNEFVDAVAEVAAAVLLRHDLRSDDVVDQIDPVVSPTFRDAAGGPPSRLDIQRAYWSWLRIGRTLGYLPEAFEFDEPDRLTEAGRAAAIAGLRARAYGPRNRP